MLPPRKIIHIDMDAFFAAVEQRDFPQYRNKPIIVGGSPNSRGVVATCSYEARQYGIHSAMPSSHAYRLCPQAIFVKPRFEVYRSVSNTIRKLLSEYTDLIEPLSLDEAYLDVSACSRHQGSATLIAKAIKTRIKQATGLTASAGISYNKFLAKIASDLDKPDGLYLITPEQGGQFIEQLAIGKFHGVGKATAQKMQSLGIATGKDLKTQPLAFLQQHFGKSGQYYYNIARGIDTRPVNPNRPRQSLGMETTFQQDIIELQDVLTHLHNLLTQVLAKLDGQHQYARTLTIKIKYHDFVQITRSRTLPYNLSNNSHSTAVLTSLLNGTDAGRRRIRLLGVTLSSLESGPNLQNFEQLDMFTQNF